MAEQLITATQVAERLGLSKQSLYRDGQFLLNRLKAKGLQPVEVPTSAPGTRKTVRYREASVDRLIRDAAETGNTLC